VTEAASRPGATATPTVQVNGNLIDNTVDALQDAVQAARLPAPTSSAAG
jgi:protein-disulfide isomerase